MENEEETEQEELPCAGDLDLAELWSEFTSFYANKQRAFLEHLRELVSDPDEIDNIEFCGNCGDPAWDDEISNAARGTIRICSLCWDDWVFCDSCGERFPADDLNSTLADDLVCDSCRDSYYTYCEHCEGYRHNDDDGHDHGSGDGCCSSPQLSFTIRNDGCEPLANDTRVTVTLPAGDRKSVV